MHAALKKLALGTVQFGLAYGITNEAGRPDPTQVKTLLQSAIQDGITYLDTAQAYGDSEQVIGDCLGFGGFGNTKVVSKLSPLADQWDEEAILKSIADSITKLKIRSLDSFLLHRADQIENEGILSAIGHALQQGLIQRFGVSVSNPSEFLRVIEHPLVQHIQLPFHLLDWRWLDLDWESIRKAKPDLCIHARSPFLQGALLTRKPEQWPLTSRTQDAEVYQKLRDFLNENANIPSAALLLGYAIHQPWIDQVVFGAQDLQQYVSNLGSAIQGFSLSPSIIRKCRDFSLQVHASEEILNPSLWKKA